MAHDSNSQSLLITTVEYRPPDIFLGNYNYDTSLDMWSFGCVAAELFLRRPFFASSDKDSKAVFRAHRELLGPPNPAASAWMAGLPLYARYERDVAQRTAAPPAWPPSCLCAGPPDLADLVRSTLQ